MSRGGHRSGSGRKPSASTGVLLDLEGRRLHRAPPLPAAMSEAERTALLEPPAEAAADPAVAAVWRELAPKALELHTLTANEVPGFLELCQRKAMVQKFDARIAVLGAGTHEAIPLVRERRAYGALLLSALKDFKLSAFGKPVTSEIPKPAANPFAQLTGS